MEGHRSGAAIFCQFAAMSLKEHRRFVTPLLQKRTIHQRHTKRHLRTETKATRRCFYTNTTSELNSTNRKTRAVLQSPHAWCTGKHVRLILTMSPYKLIQSDQKRSLWNWDYSINPREDRGSKVQQLSLQRGPSWASKIPVSDTQQSPERPLC